MKRSLWNRNISECPNILRKMRKPKKNFGNIGWMNETIKRKQIQASFESAEQIHSDFQKTIPMTKLSDSDKDSIRHMTEMIEDHLGDIHRVLKKKTVGLDQLYDMLGTLDIIKEYIEDFYAILESKEEKLL